QWWKASEATVSASTSMEVHLKALTVAVIDDATGGPAANIPVQLRTASDGWVGDKRTDANGRAVFSVVDGGYRAHLYTGQWWKASEATVSASTSMEVHLKALTVKVVDNNKGGGPAANISIQLRTASDGWVGDKRTDTKGRAVFPVVDGGYRVYIYVGQQWKKAVEVTVSASTNINVRLKGLEFDTDVDGDDDHGNDN
ncbi:MAG: hypothetical protein HYZ49_07245, partial [Chloroflexi bacterium]|nr:hypothetical protein [Chloroflexota bacterium]